MGHDFLLASGTEQHSKLAICYVAARSSPVAEICRSNERLNVWPQKTVIDNFRYSPGVAIRFEGI